MRSISTRLWILMLILISIAIALLWIFQIVFLEEYYTNIQVNKIVIEGEKLEKLVIESNSESIEAKLEELAVNYNAGTVIYDSEGATLYTNEELVGMMGGMMGMDVREVFFRVLNGENFQTQFNHKRFKSTILLVGIPVQKDSKTMGAIIITMPLAPVKETTSILKQQLKIIILILLTVSLLLSYFFSRYFTKPILKINDAASKMAAGNLAINLEVKEKDELGMLANTINNLSKQLQKNEKLRKDLIANVSHEFRTPLSLIKGYAETIRDVSGNNQDKRNKQLDIIVEESDRLKSMINDILSLSQMQSEYFKLNISKFNIVDMINTVANHFMYLTEKTRTNIYINYSNEGVIIQADEGRIEQVLYNLIENAYKYSPDQSTININIIESKTNVLIEIVDTGIGIDKEDIQYLWDRFYKSDKYGNIKHKGSGLGLSIVKEVLEAHKYNYGVESELNKGTKFWFEIVMSTK